MEVSEYFDVLAHPLRLADQQVLDRLSASAHDFPLDSPVCFHWTLAWKDVDNFAAASPFYSAEEYFTNRLAIV